MYFSILIFSRAPQLRNASFLISFTFLGISRLSKPQSAKAPAPIESIAAFSSNFAAFIFLHPLKALRPILVTVLGKSNLSRFSAFAKAFSLIFFKGHVPLKLKCFNCVFDINALSLIVSNFELSGTLIVCKLSHASKTLPISVMEEGKVTSFSLGHCQNECPLRFVILDGSRNVIEVRL